MAATAPKKRTPKAAAAAKTAAELHELDASLTEEDITRLTEGDEREKPVIEVDGTINPVEIGKRGLTPNELTHIFTLDGEQYYVPKRPSAAIMVKYLRAVRKDSTRKGRMQATEEFMLDILGEDNLSVLVASPKVGEEEMADIFAICGYLGFGRIKEMAAAAGESSRGPKK